MFVERWCLPDDVVVHCMVMNMPNLWFLLASEGYMEDDLLTSMILLPLSMLMALLSIDLDSIAFSVLPA